MARIDAILLNGLRIIFFHQLIIETPQLVQFISRTPNLKTPDKARVRVLFSNRYVRITLPQASANSVIQLELSCRQSDWQLSSLAQICSSSIPQAFISSVQHIYVHESKYRSLKLRRQDDIENTGSFTSIFKFQLRRISTYP